MAKTCKVIKGGTLIDGTGRAPLEEAVVVIEGSKIVKVGREERISVSKCEVIDAEGMTVMPGLIDMHVHVTLSDYSPAGVKLSFVRPLAITVLEAAENLRSLLEAGFTTVRECGGVEHVDIGLKKAIEMRLIPGPRLISCGTALTITGGHGDMYLPDCDNIPVPHPWGRIVDGADEARKAAREEMRAGADWIKLMHGGIASFGGQPGGPQLTIEEMKAACDEAHKMGGKVCAHAQGIQSIKDSIIAGVDTIEHGYAADEEARKMMKERGITLVPTLSPGYKRRHLTFEDHIKAGVPERIAKRWLWKYGKYEARKMNVRYSIKEKVKIAMGSDIIGKKNYGENAMELALLVDSGLSSMEAIMAATKNAAETLQIETGTIVPGKLADIILVDRNPLKDITILQDKNKIRMVMKEGRIEVRR